MPLLQIVIPCLVGSGDAAVRSAQSLTLAQGVEADDSKSIGSSQRLSLLAAGEGFTGAEASLRAANPSDDGREPAATVTGSIFCGTAESLWVGCAVRLSAEHIAGGSEETDEEH